MTVDGGVEVVSREPQPVEPLREGFHELPLRPYIVHDEKKHELEDDRGRNGDIAPCSVGILHFFVDEAEVRRPFDPSEGISRATS